MAIPTWIRWLFASLLAVVCAFCLIRLVVLSRPRFRDHVRSHWHEDAGQVLMGIGMIAMFLSVTTALPKAVWAVLFGAQAVGFAAPLLVRGSLRASDEREDWQYVHHVIASVAMAYMIVAMGSQLTGRPAIGGPAHAMIALPPLATSFGMYFLGYTAVSGVRLVAGGRLLPASGPAQAPAPLREPRLVEACRTLMGVGMTYMLLMTS